MKKFFTIVVFLQLLGLNVNAGAAKTDMARVTALEGCLYRSTAPIKIPTALTSTKGADSTSFLLRGGTYVDIVEWNCSRLGKRIFIVVPKSKDSVESVNSLLTKISQATVARSFKNLVSSSFGKEEFFQMVDIDGYEFASYAVRRTDYESIYTIIYYTAD